MPVQPPSELNDTKVVRWAWSGERRPFGELPQEPRSRSEIYGFAVGHHWRSKEYFRFCCLKDWSVAISSSHQSLNDAMNVVPFAHDTSRVRWHSVLTPGQARDRKALLRTVETEQLTSYMNRTRWKACIAAISSIPGYSARFRVRCVGDRQDPQSWDGSFPWHIPHFVSIEWLEFDPIVRSRRGALVTDICADHTADIVAALLQARIPISLESTGAVRVWGYVRPGANLSLIKRSQPEP